MFREVEDPFPPGRAEDWVDVFSAAGPRAFALRVVGDSMVNPHAEPSFPDGCIIVVDPDRAPTAGAYVVAKDMQTHEATFKRLAFDGGRWFLRPLNPQYPNIEIDNPELRVIGVAIEMSTTEEAMTESSARRVKIGLVVVPFAFLATTCALFSRPDVPTAPVAAAAAAEPGTDKKFALLLNLNGLLCADVVRVSPLQLAQHYEVECTTFRGGQVRATYIADLESGRAYRH